MLITLRDEKVKTQASVYIFFILLSLFLMWYCLGEFVGQSRGFLVGHISFILLTYVLDLVVILGREIRY